MRLNPDQDRNIKAEFETCIGRIESQGLIKRLKFGDLILLQPELMDAYASALINAAKHEPEELGCMAESRIKSGDFFIPTEEKISNKDDEKLLLLAMIEDLLNHEIAFRETVEDNVYLVFPSQFKKEKPELPDPKGKEIIFTFEGAIQNIYTTLAVRLSHSKIFQKKEMWKNAAIYETRRGGEYSIYLHEIDEGHAELTLFFSGQIDQIRKSDFEDYIKTHLSRRALPTSVKYKQIFICKECNTLVTDQAIQRRRERGLDWINCGVCDDVKISILNRDETLNRTTTAIAAMDSAADKERDKAVAITVAEGKKAMNEFDVFLCHNSEDKDIVKKIGLQLKERGILAWLDEWELRPGTSWQRELENQISNIKSAAVFVGAKGFGPWQQLEQEAFLREFVKRACPVIPVILPTCEKPPTLPVFLSGLGWVDFRRTEPDPIKQLIWGITGKRMDDDLIVSEGFNKQDTSSRHSSHKVIIKSSQKNKQIARLDNNQIDQLAQLLLKCARMLDAQDTIVHKLADEIQHNIKQHAVPIVQIRNIVETCNNYENGITTLLDALESLEGNSFAMRAIAEFIDSI